MHVNEHLIAGTVQNWRVVGGVFVVKWTSDEP